MIIDTLDHVEHYARLGPDFKLAFDYLCSDRPNTDAIGRYELDGDRVFAMVQEYETTPFDPQDTWEAHRKYADIQLLVSGREQIGYAPLKNMTESQPYNEEDDYALYCGQGTLMPLCSGGGASGGFAVYFPQDVHKPGVADGTPANVRKVVMKILVSE